MSDSTEVTIRAGDASLKAFLAVPPNARGMVLFAHGSGSSRFSPRNRQVADDLNAHGYATLLLDLLDEREHAQDQLTGEFRFDIPLLASRMVHAIEHARSAQQTRALRAGLFGASTGAAAALIAAARRPEDIAAVVSRGGRPDLAGDALAKVRAPVLLIVGGKDQQVIDLNRHAAERLVAEHHLAIVADASHLFEEPGRIEEVQRLAREWFDRFLPGIVP